MIAHRGEGVCQRISRIERDRALQRCNRSLSALRHTGIDVRLSLQDKIVGVQAIRPLAFDALDLGAPQTWLNRADDRQRDFILQSENIVEFAVIALNPHMRSRRGIDELCGMRSLSTDLRRLPSRT